MLSIDHIKGSTLSRFYERGRQLYRGGHVKKMTRQSFGESLGVRPAMQVKGEVEGSKGAIYDTTLFIRDNKILSYGCGCKAADQFPYPCKHCIALSLAYRESQIAGTEDLTEKDRLSDPIHPMGPPSSGLVKDLIYKYSMQENASYYQAHLTGKVDLIPILHQQRRGWQIEFKIGAEGKFYVLKDIGAFVKAVEEKEKAAYGKNLEFIHEESVFTPRARQLYGILKRSLEERNLQDHNSYYQTSRFTGKIRQLALSEESLADVFSVLWPQPCQCADGNREIHFSEEHPQLELRLTEAEESGYELELPEVEMFTNGRETFLIEDYCVYRCDEAFKNSMEMLCQAAGSPYCDTSLHINEKDMRAFCSSVLPSIEEFTQVKGLELTQPFQPEPCRICFYLDHGEGRITCRIESIYGENHVCDPLKSMSISDMYRDAAMEGRAAHTAANYFSQKEEGLLWMGEDEEDLLYTLFSEGLFRMEQLGEVYLSQALKGISIKSTPAMGIQVGMENGRLNLRLDIGDMSSEEMEGLLKAYRFKKKYYRLTSGDFLTLEDNSLETVWELAEGLELSGKDLTGGSVEIPRYRSLYIDQVLKSCGGGMTVKRSSSYKSLIRSIKAVEDSDYQVPESMEQILREYQKIGYRWLMTLWDLGFGGILADDMGLGKSLQILTFLYAAKEEADKQEHKPTSLLVCPASLVYNWEEETAKFVPDMKVLLMIGTASERGEKIASWEDYDLVVTSYDLLKRDEELYEGKHFYCQVLDEAQNIKNHATKAARAVKNIHAQNRFALTGTPIENRLSELWSIFEFLMPGILGSYAAFRRKYELPITQNSDERMSRRLQRIISPFILRRLKKDVLNDLPEKNETIVYSRMEKEQEDLYKANAKKLADTIANKNGQEFRTGKIEILSGLMRLRQLCCDPSLVYEDYPGAVGKLDTCMELVETALESGKKILLFSQFTSMLDRIAKELEQRGISFYMLTGATGKKQRLDMVHQFNDGEVPIFLISLKAGGTGLNLTSATVVIHYDPWWNIAAENQASDRAHRIGQEKEVTVFKLIMKNTIEEQIRKLQEAKAHLADEMISGQSLSVSDLSREDFVELLRV